MGEITVSQFDALAELLRADSNSARYRSAKLILVDGLSIGDAAREAGTSYNAAHQAASAYRKGIELAAKVCGSL